MTFQSHKFRCSQLPKLFTNGRKKDELFGETTKSFLLEEYIRVVYDRDQFIMTSAMQKGIMCESDSLDLVYEVTGKMYFKNKKKLENDFIQGTPDIIESDTIHDVKTSWNLWTFLAVTEEEALKNYKHQMMGYCYLANLKKAELIYCLLDTPEELINKEILKAGAAGIPEREKIIRKNHTYSDIPAEKRIKRFQLEFTQENFKEIDKRVIAAREYLTNIN